MIGFIQGWFNYLSRNNKSEVMAKNRAEHCSTCKFKSPIIDGDDFIRDKNIPSISGMYCMKCLCPLPAKLRSQSESCPIGKW